MQKPIKRRIFVFAVRERQRLRNYSRLYKPNSNRGMLTRAEDVWVLNAARDCIIHPWKKGQHLLISDGFELEPIDLDFWDQYMDDPAFKKLKEFSESTEGKVHTTVIHEDSVFAEVDGDLFQEDTMW